MVEILWYSCVRRVRWDRGTSHVRNSNQQR